MDAAIKEDGMTGRRQNGVAAVEFALVISLLLLVLGGVIEFGRLFWQYDALVKAGHAGARYMANTLDRTGAHAIVRSAANSAGIVAADLPDSNIACECGYGSSGEVIGEAVAWSTDCASATPKYVRVLIDYSFTLGGLMPLANVMPRASGPIWQGVTVLTIHPATAMRYLPPLN